MPDPAKKSAETLFAMLRPGWTIIIDDCKYMICQDQRHPTEFLKAQSPGYGEVHLISRNSLVRAILRGDKISVSGSSDDLESLLPGAV